jgi:hypothetical protein
MGETKAFAIRARPLGHRVRHVDPSACRAHDQNSCRPFAGHPAHHRMTTAFPRGPTVAPGPDQIDTTTLRRSCRNTFQSRIPRCGRDGPGLPGDPGSSLTQWRCQQMSGAIYGRSGHSGSPCRRTAAERPLSAVPDMPAVPTDTLWRGTPYLVTDDGRHTLGWQVSKKDGRVFVVVRMSVLHTTKVLARFPLTEDG